MGLDKIPLLLGGHGATKQLINDFADTCVWRIRNRMADGVGWKARSNASTPSPDFASLRAICFRDD